MVYGLVVFSFIGFSLGVLFAYDILRWGIHKLGHVRLRGWNPKQVGAWRVKVLSCAEQWMKRPPVLPATDEYKYWLVERMRGRGGDASIQGWQLAPIVMGIRELGGMLESRMVFKLLDKISVIDFGILIYCGMCAGELFGERLHQVMSRFLEVVGRLKNEKGLVPYRSVLPTTGYSDTLAFLCPVLVKYGSENGRSDLVALGLNQIRHYHEQGGYLKPHGIYAHAYDYQIQKPAESIGWGRGTGWYLLAVIWCYGALEDGAERKWLLQCIVEAVENILPLQTKDGGWCTQLVRQVNFDSSATVIFAYFLVLAYPYLKDERCAEAALRAVRKLMRVTRRSGALDYAEGVCMGIGRYSRRYSVSPFAQGMLLCLFAELDKIVPDWEDRISS